MSHINIPDATTVSSLSAEEKTSIQQKIEFEITRWHYSMLKMGAIANIIAGAIFVWALYSPQTASIIVKWYAVLVVMNLLNIAWSFRYSYQTITMPQLKTWRKVFLVFFGVIAVIWSGIAIIFSSETSSHQLLIFIFLLAALVCFSLSTVTDFALSAIGIIGLLAPAIGYRLYLGIHQLDTFGSDPNANLALSAALIICGLFLLIACYFGARIVRKFFRLSFENVELNVKLENLNKFLEKRVAERTIDLEKSLKLVTYQATHDLLTDLPNQRSLDNKISEAIIFAQQNNSMFAVIYFYINEIEKINDTYGYEAGEQTIKMISQRLEAAFPKANTRTFNQSHYYVSLARKDNFVLILEPVDEINQLKNKIEELFSLFVEPVQVENHSIKLTASIGVSVYPQEGNDKKTLLKNASNAMLNAKLKGGNSISTYIPKNTIDFSHQLQLTSALHSALENDEFIMYYQPIVDIKSSKIVKVEALVRWYNPTRGFISPVDFVPLAESSGIIIPLGEWVFRTACKQTKSWHDMGFSHLKVAINLSSRQLQSNIIKIFGDILKEIRIQPELVELELTETEAFKEDVIPILKLFKQMNMGLSIDDFGTGYSGLTNLRLLSIDTLKIDKSFIDDVTTNSRSQTIVSNTINLAKKMGVTVLAEGVETKEQLDFLREHGCDLVQGYYFSQPHDTGTITELLESVEKMGFQKKGG